MKLVLRIINVVAVIYLAVGCQGCGASAEDGGPPLAAEDEADELGVEAQAVLTPEGQRRVPTPAIVKALQKATAGLLFLSESDYPFEVLYWRAPGGSPTAARIAAVTGEDANGAEERSIDGFFNGATTAADWQSPEELQTVRRYQDLVALCKAKLHKIKVYRFGKIQIHAYVFGVTSAGNWVALKTTQIET